MVSSSGDEGEGLTVPRLVLAIVVALWLVHALIAAERTGRQPAPATVTVAPQCDPTREPCGP